MRGVPCPRLLLRVAGTFSLVLAMQSCGNGAPHVATLSGATQASLDGVPVPAEARPLPGAASSPTGDDAVYRLPKVSDTQVRDWFAQHLPPVGGPWDGLAACPDGEANPFGNGVSALVLRRWAGQGGSLEVEVSRLHDGLFIDVSYSTDNPLHTGFGC